jgi:spore maturation protein SpmA
MGVAYILGGLVPFACATDDIPGLISGASTTLSTAIVDNLPEVITLAVGIFGLLLLWRLMKRLIGGR